MTTLGNEIVQKWLAALRSGKYKKGKFRLKKSNSEGTEKLYCCLGVLCEVMGLESDDTTGQECFYDEESGPDRIRFTLFLPDIACKAVGVTATGIFKEPIKVEGSDKPIGALSGLNDTTDLEFPEIADIIEENIKADNFIKVSGGEVCS